MSTSTTCICTPDWRGHTAACVAANVEGLRTRLSVEVVRHERLVNAVPLARIAAAAGKRVRDLTTDEHLAIGDAIDLDTQATKPEWVIEVRLDGAELTEDGDVRWFLDEVPVAFTHKTLKGANAAAAQVIDAMVGAMARVSSMDWAVEQIPFLP